MSRDKHEIEASSSSSKQTMQLDGTLVTLSKDTASKVANHMTIQDIYRLARVSRVNYSLFQPILDQAKEAHPLLKALVEANRVHRVYVCDGK